MFFAAWVDATRSARLAFSSKDDPKEEGEREKITWVTKDKYESLLDAEQFHCAVALTPHPMTLSEILAHKDIDSLRLFLLEELPIRYARRLQLIESMPNWNSIPHMRVIRGLYSDAFRRLRCIPPDDAEGFRGVLTHIKRRNANMLVQVVRGTMDMREKMELQSETINAFLDTFLTARIETDILSSQYLALSRPTGPTSVIDSECDPVSIIEYAAEDATHLCKHHYGRAPAVDITKTGSLKFPFISQFLNYMIFELLKNSLRAVTERHSAAALKRHPIRVVVCGDDDTVVVRISDSGGGIPLDKMNEVWSYLYTTAKPPREESGQDPYASDGDEIAAPLAGFGCGLPLSRNYASYVGGRLEINSMPQYGTDAYLYLNRMDRHEVDVDPKGLPSRDFLPKVSPEAERTPSSPFRHVKTAPKKKK